MKMTFEVDVRDAETLAKLDQRAHLSRNIRFGNNAWFSKALEDGKCGSQNNPRFSC
jgi:hypothetical protein